MSETRTGVGRPADSVLHELVPAVEEIAVRFAAGDPCPELIARLSGRLDELRAAGTLPAELRDAVTRLCGRVAAAAAGGEAWLADAVAERQATAARAGRLRRAYGLPP
jgi:hypothetical protein